MVRMNLFGMLQSACANLARDKAAQENGRSATFERKKRAKWAAVFEVFAGKASTNELAGYMGRAPSSIIKTMHGLEKQEWVIRADTLPKSGGPGHSQIIWEWVG